MISPHTHIESILTRKEQSALRVTTLGFFEAEVDSNTISDSDWKREIAIQLFQFLLTIRNQRALHKSQIIDRIWGNLGEEAGNRNFKAALHSITKVIEPERSDRSPSQYIIRQGQTYRLDTEKIWIDIDALDEFIIIGNQALKSDTSLAIRAYQYAIELYQGDYLPNRIYEDWSADERERIQVLVLGAMMTLSKLTLSENPQESIRLAKQTLMIDPTWEEAYRIQMEAYMQEGNRPLAVKAYQKCKQILKQEFDIEPLQKPMRCFTRSVDRVLVKKDTDDGFAYG